ncbi:MAG TPA: DUF3574 domain-containing protein [Vicinamibacterales bacterium]|nr:DUF3574 domain-containing protein [Vicinamibacterales bacterium]
MNRQLLLAIGLASGLSYVVGVAAQPAPPAVCGTASSPQLRTTLYFGTNRPTGTVSELEWQLFVRDEVTTRFPDGLTVWDAHGQWKEPGGAIAQERSKVLLIVHADSDKARNAVQGLIGRYRKVFEQQSVLWETARVCVAM